MNNKDGRPSSRSIVQAGEEDSSNSQRATSGPTSSTPTPRAAPRGGLTTGRRLEREEIEGAEMVDTGTTTTSDGDSPNDPPANHTLTPTPAPQRVNSNGSNASSTTSAQRPIPRDHPLTDRSMPSTGRSAATVNSGSKATLENDSLAETPVAGQGAQGRPPLTPTSARSSAGPSVVRVPPAGGTSTTGPATGAPVVTTNIDGVTVKMPNGDSFAFPPDMYEAIQPMRQRSALITGVRPYQAVADDPRTGRTRSYLVRNPQQAQPRPQAGSLRGQEGQNDPFAAVKLSPRSQNSFRLGVVNNSFHHSSPENASTVVEVHAGGAASGTAPPTSASFIPPTAEDPNELPSLAAAYLKGDVRADLLSANDPINNYTFFIGGSDTGSDDEEPGAADGGRATGVDSSEACDADGRASRQRNDSILHRLRQEDSSLSNPLDLQRKGFDGRGASNNHIPFGTPGSEDSIGGMDPRLRNQNSSLYDSSGSTYNPNSPGLPAAKPPSTSNGPQQLDLNEAAALVENLSRSFAMNRQGRTASPIFGPSNASFAMGPNAHASGVSPHNGSHFDPLPAVMEELNKNTEPINDASTGKDGEVAAAHLQPDGGKPPLESYMDTDAFTRLPMPYREPCYSRFDLDDDTVSFTAAWQSLKSETFSRHILSGFRVTLFAVMPMFVLTKHPNTSGWFSAGALLPIIAGLFVRPNLGAQVIMTVLAIQTCICFIIWGTLMNAVGAVNHVSGWWCGVIFGSFVPCMFGDMLAKRLMMMYVIILMQMEHTPGGAELVYPSKFAKDFLIATVVAFVACLLPFPILAVRQLNEAMIGLHKLYGAGVGNAMKAYWAPVNIDQKAALSQVPFPKIRGLTGQVKALMFANSYEPTEFNLNNILRGERLGVLQRVKMHLYQMSAAASQRIGEGQQFTHRLPKEVRDFEKRVRGPAMELATEIIAVLPELGKYIKPEDVATKINYDTLYNKAAILSDIVDRERAQTFFLRQTNPSDTNSYLRTFAFLGSLIDMAAEIEKLEIKMREFDPSKYPSFWRRSWNFVIGDIWRDFWEELPKRLTLATPRDVRMLKDGIKYTLGFAVACAFTLNYDHSNVYYFGMAILVRLAQQTASETLNVGIFRICGLCIGAAISYITYNKTHNLAEETLLTMTFVFIFMCFATHPVYQWGAQYGMVISITGLSLAGTPSLLLTRMVDNVFAFISYFLICSFIFPVDPIRVLWNTRTKIFLNLNALMQSFVTLGCCPITMGGEEASMFLAEAKKMAGQQALLLKDYGDWMAKCTEEPTIRGGPYPNGAVVKLLLYLTEASSLEEAMLDAMVRLHRVRTSPPSVLLQDIMELTRPFLHDAGKIIQRYIQNMIDATEVPKQWSMEEALSTLWKGQIACRSLRNVTGNIQRNFYAAVQQLDSSEKERMNVYLPSSMVFEALSQENDPRLLNPENEDLLKRLFAMSFHMSKESLVSRDDMQAFNAIVIVFELMLKVLEQMLPYMVEIHEFEKSRVL